MTKRQLRPTIETVEIERLTPAPWNPKPPASEALFRKLAESIHRDRSCGVLAVRELPDKSLEVIDGNHRLEAVRFLGWPEVTVENFGRITTPEAVTISHRRNHEWIATDDDKFAALLRDVVVPEIPLAELEAILPDTRAELEHLIARPPAPDDTAKEGFRTISIIIPQDVYELWQKWQARVAEETHTEPAPATCFEYAIAEALGAAPKARQVAAVFNIDGPLTKHRAAGPRAPGNQDQRGHDGAHARRSRKARRRAR